MSAAQANRLYYATRAAEYDQTEECMTQKRHQDRLQQTLKMALAGAQRHDHILDACGGSGYASLELGAMGLTPVTVDISPDMLEIYRSNASEAGLVATTHVSDIESFLETSPERWDLIVFSSALHHLEDYCAVLVAAIGRLADGGVIATVFDPTRTGGVGYMIRYADYLLWMAVRHPLTLAGRLSRRVSQPADSSASVGRIAERHALSGIDDLSLAQDLEHHGLEIVVHDRYFEARFAATRALLRLLQLPSSFSFIARRATST